MMFGGQCRDEGAGRSGIAWLAGYGAPRRRLLDALRCGGVWQRDEECDEAGSAGDET